MPRILSQVFERISFSSLQKKKSAKNACPVILSHTTSKYLAIEILRHTYIYDPSLILQAFISTPTEKNKKQFFTMIVLIAFQAKHQNTHLRTAIKTGYRQTSTSIVSI